MASTVGRKLFVGSLPMGIEESVLRSEFSRYGDVDDIFIKPNCEPGRQWAFVTMADKAQAESAKQQTDRILVVPGAENPCDVLVAKNQGMFGQSSETPPPVMAGKGAVQYEKPLSNTAATKIFVGSLPDGISEGVLRDEFSKYGLVSDIFIKQGCEPGRQWAFVSFRTADEANHAQQMTNNVLQFPGAYRACEVTMARNQGMFGNDPIAYGPPKDQGAYPPGPTEAMVAPKKIFVGSLPTAITESNLRAEFAKYGQITDVHVNNKPCESGRQWAFVTFVSPDQAKAAKVACDRILVFPGGDKPCEVTLARHQGMFGQEPVMDNAPVGAHAQYPYPYETPASTGTSPKKIFVGSLPENVSDSELRSEFSKYGQVTDVYISTKPCEPGRNWAFVTFTTAQQAQYAKDQTDRILMMPGAERPCEVMLAKNQGKFGQDSMGAPAVAPSPAPHIVYAQPRPGPSQPPPPAAPPPSHLTPWRMYKTAAGLPYYHNSHTGVTQWECPPDLQVPGQTNVYQMPPPQPSHYPTHYPSHHYPSHAPHHRYAPY